MTLISVWNLLRLSHCDPYFDDTACRALELNYGLAEGSIAWIKESWPGVEFYLYDNKQGRREVVNNVHGGLVFERVKDHGVEMDCDWIVKVKVLP